MSENLKTVREKIDTFDYRIIKNFFSDGCPKDG